MNKKTQMKCVDIYWDSAPIPGDTPFQWGVPTGDRFQLGVWSDIISREWNSKQENALSAAPIRTPKKIHTSFGRSVREGPPNIAVALFDV